MEVIIDLFLCLMTRYKNCFNCISDHEVIVEIDNPNSVHAVNRFEEGGHAKRKYNHFRLIDLTREELHAMGVPGILDDEEE